jgi:hypothetical protein
MKRSIGWVVGLVILIAVVLWFLPRHRPATPTGESKKRTTASAPSPKAAAASDSTTKAAAARVAVPDVKAPPTPQAKSLTIRADQVLVKVNGVAITGKDLMPFDPANPDQTKSMSPEAYQYLLDRAIERELTFQEAKKEGVELTDSQRQQLDQLRQSLKKEEEEKVQKGLIAHMSSGAPVGAVIDFQVHDSTAAMLLNALLDNAGVPPQYVNSAVVMDYYKAHSNDYPPLPTDTNEVAAAWNEIFNDISQRLAPTMLQEHLAGRADYIQQLKSSAQIVTNQPSS